MLELFGEDVSGRGSEGGREGDVPGGRRGCTRNTTELGGTEAQSPRSASCRRASAAGRDGGGGVSLDGREEGGRGRDCLGPAGTREFDLNNWRSEGGGTRQRPMMGHAKQNLTSSSTTPARAGGGAACAEGARVASSPRDDGGGGGQGRTEMEKRRSPEATHGRCPAARLDVSGGLHRPAPLFSLPPPQPQRPPAQQCVGKPASCNASSVLGAQCWSAPRAGDGLDDH